MSQFLSPGQMWKPGTGPSPAAAGEPFASPQAEIEAANHRLVWLLGSQSLLFAGYAVLVTANADRTVPNAALSLLQTWLPRLGGAVAALLLIGMVAAALSSWLSRRAWNGFGSTRLRVVTSWAGWAPALLLPVLFIVVWSSVAAPAAPPPVAAAPAAPPPAAAAEDDAAATDAKDKRRGKRGAGGKKAAPTRYAGDLRQ
jgi:hypothetical protein